MPIFKGTTEIDSVKIGDTQISQVYAGAQEIWANVKVIDLGWGQSFDVRALYPKYSQLTVNNFFFLSANSVSGGDSVRVTSTTEYLRIWTGMQKGYSNGILTFFSGVNNNHANVRAVLVSDPSKLVYLGYGTSFNVRNSFPDSYGSMTNDNFIILKIRHPNPSGGYDEMWGRIFNDSRTAPGDYSASDTWSFTKSYNASNGTLSCYANDSGSSDIGQSFGGTSNVYAYAYKKAVV